MEPDTSQPDYNPKQHVGNELSVMQPGEQKVCEIKRHPLGITAIYVMIGFVLIVIAGLVFGLLPSLSSNTDTADSINKIGIAVFLILAVVSALYSLVATKVYWGNRWIVTTDSVTQVNQRSLFSRESAQLALANIEDVTAEQNGILAHMFNYGVIKVETAGHREKFSFLYCPNPNYYAQQILEAREKQEMAMHHQVNETPPAQPQPYNQPGPDPTNPTDQSNFRSNY